MDHSSPRAPPPIWPPQNPLAAFNFQSDAYHYLTPASCATPAPPHLLPHGASHTSVDTPGTDTPYLLAPPWNVLSIYFPPLCSFPSPLRLHSSFNSNVFLHTLSPLYLQSSPWRHEGWQLLTSKRNLFKLNVLP